MKLRQPSSGSSRVPKASYYQGQTRSAKPFEKPASKNKPKKSHKILDLLIVTILGFILLYGLVLNPAPKVRINSSAYHSLGTYQAVADSASQGLRNKNKLTYNESGVMSSIKTHFPEVDQVVVKLPVIGQHPSITILIAKPLFVLSSAGGDFILDKTGVAVPKGQIKTAGLVQLSDKSGVIIKGGDRVLSSDNVQFLEQVLAQLNSAKVPVASIDLPALPQEFDVRTKDAGYYTKFYFGGDAIVQSGQFLAARHEFSQKNITPSQYLDVRVAGKVFYK